MKTLIAHGAEAKLYKIKENNNILIIKERIPKSYRIKELDDKIRRSRNRREISLLSRASGIIQVPKIIESEEFSFVMDFIEGKRLSETLDDFSENKRLEICREVGKNVAFLHNNNIVHGDLTTSNMILKGNKVYFIDFGLGFIDQKDEHKAVDLHLLKQALESKHYRHFESSFGAVLHGYKEFCNDYSKIIERFSKV